MSTERTKFIHVRVTEEEHKALNEMARKYGVTAAVIVRRAVQQAVKHGAKFMGWR